MDENSQGLLINQLKELQACLLEGKKAELIVGVKTLLAEHTTPQLILREALIPGMAQVGEKMARKEFFIPEVLMAAMAMQGALEIIKPLLTEGQFQPRGAILLGTVKGDLHDIGKNLVRYMLEGAGFDLVDLGINVSPEKFVEAITQKRPAVVGMSAMLTTTMGEMASTIKLMEQSGVRNAVKVLVGGAPVSHAFALEIGADGYAEDAGGVIGEVERLLGVS